MNQVQIFNNEKLGKVRVVVKDGKEWFCLKDVCDILGLTNPSEVRKRLKVEDLSTIEVFKNRDNMQVAAKMAFITETNLYKVIFQSRKPEAEAFTEWVTGEVLPSIRKTGQYNPKVTMLDTMELAVKCLREIESKQKEQAKSIARLENTINRTVTTTNYTVLGYCMAKGINPNDYNASVIGRKATQLCKLEKRENEIGKVVDSRYGLINTYPCDILDKIFFN